MKQITYTRAAIKVLKSMPRIVANRIVANRIVANRIVAKVEEYANDPASQANDITALKGREGIRLRVGDWRVMMHDGVVLAVLEIGPRGDVYRSRSSAWAR